MPSAMRSASIVFPVCRAPFRKTTRETANGALCLDLLHIPFELSPPAFYAYCVPPSSLRPRRRQHAGMSTERRLRIYDHRLVRLVQETGDARIATSMGGPPSTVAGWLKRAPRTITPEPGVDYASEIELRVRVAKLEKRMDRLSAVLRILFALFRLLQPDLQRLRIPHASDKARLLRAIDRSACPRFSPHELTADETSAIRAMVTSPDFRHVPTGRLAILAQRLGRVLAQTAISFSNSLIEAWWRVLKHSWLFLNQLDSAVSVRKLVAFYVEEHNTRLPHSAFQGQTPDEMYSGTGNEVPDNLRAARQDARRRRLDVNRAARCGVCA